MLSNMSRKQRSEKLSYRVLSFTFTSLSKTLFGYVTCPLDAAVMAYYLIGKVHYNLKEYAVAESIFKGSLAVLQQLATYDLAFSRFGFLSISPSRYI